MNGGLSSVCESVLSVLSGDPELAKIKAVSEYPASPRENPLSTPMICVGLQSAELLSPGQGSGLSFDSRFYNVTVSFKILVPKSRPGSDCREIFSKLADCLISSQSLNIISLRCDRTVYDSVEQVYTLCAYAGIRVGIAPILGGDPVSSLSLELIPS